MPGPIASRVRNVGAAKLPSREDGSSAMVLDSHGVVTSCGEATGSMFACSVDNLVGRAIWDLISNMTPSYTSPSFNARYLAAMSKDSRWRPFQAVDTLGRTFPVELSLSCVAEEDGDLFLLLLRHPAGEFITPPFRVL
jgi:hypothetical protein